MAQPAAANRRIVQFGLFELDLDARELRKSGIRIKLQEQPFQILVMLLERRGEIVTREELQKQLWPQDTFVDFDLSLNSAVKKLRQALGDDSANPRFIETLYRRGYRFVGQTNGAVTPSVDQESQLTKPRKINLQLLAWTIPAALILIIALIWLTKPLPTPRIIGYTQITHDGLHKGPIVTDSERLYFAELHDGDHFVVAQVSVLGGETSSLAAPFPEFYPPDIATDGSALLVVEFSGTKEGLLFSLPLPTGSPQRLNNVFGHAATWSRDRSQLVFASRSEIYAANGNGSEPRKLVTVDGTASDLRFSPDGRKLRFSVLAPNSGSSALWELNRDGSNLHPLLPAWNTPPNECCGNWTPDGKYYVFQSLRNGKTNLWLLPDQTGSFRPHAKPLQLTNGPLDFTFPVVSKDGKKIFADGTQARGELVRYNGHSDFVPYLGGISATDLSFSPDGKSVAYVSVPEEVLWRSNIDGTQRLQLTDASLHASLPRWSPDGKQIVFMGQAPNTNWRAYTISSDGGTPHDLAPSAQAGFDPGWSPDGKSVVMTLNEGGNPGISLSGPGIAIVDLQTGNISLLPDAAQLFSPRWSPDGKYIAAITADSQKVVLFDFATRQWTDLVTMQIGYHTWSHDGRYLYFDSTLTGDPAFFRVRISDHKLERVASLKG
ncbi:MAG TPA: winged helix-turn-helix domain-containing protein, partial [Chthoniobacterales bacterium]|nr:winged helix-turn-helix domain-containing protein [Chthoniobacterales bacterium]